MSAKKINKLFVNLIIDIGNTCAKIAVFDNNTLKEVVYNSNQDLADVVSICYKYGTKRAIVATVVPLSEVVENQLSQLGIPLLYLDANTPLPIINLYKTPQTLGYDRIAAVVGAAGERPDKDLLVVDAGTCITYEFIDSKKQYHGGNISPGLQMRFKALHHFTGKLPLISSEGDLPFWGDTTETAIRAGVWQGIQFEISGYIEAMRYKYPELLVFLTGGDEFSFDESIKSIIFADRFLVLKGLNRILNFNNGRI